MEHTPLVSIIIPTYNNALIVCDAIDCALRQTHGNVEVLVIDDGSTDNTEQMLKGKYKDGIIYIRQENRGPGSARNTGLRNASGQYVQFLDADDLLAPEKIRLQIEALRNVPDLAVSYSDYVCCDRDDISVTYPERYLSPVLQKENPLDDILLKWETELSIPIHSFVFDMAFFKKHGIAFDEKLTANEDWECWMNVFKLNPKVVYVDKILAYYRIRSGSRCSNRKKMRNGHVVAIATQIHKNRSNRELVNKLTVRKRRMKYLYRDAGLVMRLLSRCHPVVQELYTKGIPWRIQRILD